MGELAPPLFCHEVAWAQEGCSPHLVHSSPPAASGPKFMKVGELSPPLAYCDTLESCPLACCDTLESCPHPSIAVTLWRTGLHLAWAEPAL